MGERKKLDCLAYPSNQEGDPKTVAEFIEKLTAVLEQISITTLHESGWWEEYLIWMKQFELHVQDAHTLKARIMWELRRVREEVILYRSIKADTGNPISIAEMEGFIRLKLKPRINFLKKLMSFPQSHQM